MAKAFLYITIVLSSAAMANSMNLGRTTTFYFALIRHSPNINSVEYATSIRISDIRIIGLISSLCCRFDADIGRSGRAAGSRLRGRVLRSISLL